MRDVFQPSRSRRSCSTRLGGCVEVGLAAEEPHEERERFAERVDHAVRELEALLQLKAIMSKSKTHTITNHGCRQADPQRQPLGSHTCLDLWAPETRNELSNNSWE